MRYFLDPFGCVKNQVTAENMMACLNKAGWDTAQDAETADLIIVNSCGFIESAKQESINAVLGWRRLYPEKKILLAGCLAQRYMEELSQALPEADGLFGVEDPAGIAQTAAVTVGVAAPVSGKGATGLRKLAPRRPALVRRTEVPLCITKKEIPPEGQRPLLSRPGSAYVKISEGCDNRCAYCAIPLIWGGLRSRDIGGIKEECRALLGRGIKELCIIGQDTGSFGHDSHGRVDECAGNFVTKRGSSKLPELLKAISSLNGDFWVRLLYIHPDNFPLPILDIMQKDTRFLPYFDIPFQHASAKILGAMNRRGTAEKYLELLETIRGSLPDAVIRSTFLLGFPGETDEDFASLLDFQEKAKMDWLGCFTYSREEGTASFSMKGRVSKKIAARRKQIVEERQVRITESNMDRFVGRTLDVLIEEQIGDFRLGRLYCHAPEIDGSAVISGGIADNTRLQAGDIVPCKVIARRGFDLEVVPVL